MPAPEDVFPRKGMTPSACRLSSEAPRAGETAGIDIFRIFGMLSPGRGGSRGPGNPGNESLPMKNFLLLACLGSVAASLSFAAEPALTIYNQDFAVVRSSVALDLKPGINDVKVQDVTARLEPDSVILRDPSGKVPLQILEQGYRNDPVSQGLLLAMNEGKSIDFLVREPNKPDRTVTGKIIRSGYVSPEMPSLRLGQPRFAPPNIVPTEPIIEVDGTLRFGLPGLPVFPSLGDDAILKPQLSWKLNAAKAETVDAELCYLTGGMSWEADYNLVAAAEGGELDIVGWITMENRSGKTFENGRIKLMAGDVNKLEPDGDAGRLRAGMAMAMNEKMAAPVTEKAFDEYHLYTLARPTTLRQDETKQVEFVRAAGVKAEKIYIYDGLLLDWNRWRGAGAENLRRSEDFGAESGTKVKVVREFKNSQANGLGIPLPAGRLRFYQRDDDKQLEFIGENRIDHTPKDETIRVETGNAFDLVGQRERTDFKTDVSNHWAEETFKITLRNRKKEAVEIRVVEHLYRWTNWEILEKSAPFEKVDAQRIEFRIPLKPDEESILTYKVRYSW